MSKNKDIKPQVGGPVSVTIDGKNYVYKIRDILTPTTMLITRDENSPESIYLRKDVSGTWKIPHYKGKQKVHLKQFNPMSIFFTKANKDTGKLALLEIEDEYELDAACRTYAKDLCDEDFYKQRLKRVFPGAIDFMYDPDLTYADFYYNLSAVYSNPRDTFLTFYADPLEDYTLGYLSDYDDNQMRQYYIKNILIKPGAVYPSTLYYFYELDKQNNLGIFPDSLILVPNLQALIWGLDVNRNLISPQNIINEILVNTPKLITGKDAVEMLQYIKDNYGFVPNKADKMIVDRWNDPLLSAWFANNAA